MSVSTAIRNPRGFVSGKWRLLKILLSNPERFYEERGTSDRLWNELLVLLFVGLASSAGGLFVAQTVMSNFYTGNAPIGGSDAQYGVSSDVGIQMWGYSLRGVVGVFVLWIAFTTVLYLVSWLYSDYGSYFAMAKNTAWALVPLFVGNLIKSLGYVAAAWNAWDDGTIEVAEGDLVQSADDLVAFLVTQVLSEPAALVGIAVSALFVGWCGYIAAYGVADVRDIPVSDALRVAAVPTVVYAGYVLYQVVSLAGIL